MKKSKNKQICDVCGEEIDNKLIMYKGNPMHFECYQAMIREKESVIEK